MPDTPNKKEDFYVADCGRWSLDVIPEKQKNDLNIIRCRYVVVEYPGCMITRKIFVPYPDKNG